MKKSILALLCIILMFSFCACANDSDTRTYVEENEDPVYYSFGDISFQLNQESNTYEQVKTYKELSFEEIDENGDWVDWSDAEKEDFWKMFVYGSPWEQVFFQDWTSSDFVTISRLSLADSAYSTLDDYVDGLADNGALIEREKITLNEIPAYTLYFDFVDDEDEYPTDSSISFIYNDYIYTLDVSSCLGDVYTITEEAIDGTELN